MKETICTVIGMVGGFIAAIVGGWDSALVTLVIFMGVDFVTGFVTAAMGKSKHSASGRLNSKAGWVGLAKKFCVLLMIVVAVCIDILLGTTYIHDVILSIILDNFSSKTSKRLSGDFEILIIPSALHSRRHTSY